MRLVSGYIYIEAPLGQGVDREKLVEALAPLVSWYEREAIFLTRGPSPGHEQLARDIDRWGEIDEHCEQGPSLGYDEATRVLTFMHLGQFPWDTAKQVMHEICCNLEPFATEGYLFTIEENGAALATEAEDLEASSYGYFGPSVDTREAIRLRHQVERANACLVSFRPAEGP